MGPGQLLFSPHGRISRSTWWIGFVAIVAFNVVMGVLLWRVFDASLILTVTGRITMLPVNLLSIYMAYCVAAKRFADRDRPLAIPRAVAGVGMLKAMLDLFHITGDIWVPNILDHIFLAFFLVIGLWYIVELGILRGTEGPNKYGPNPLNPAAAL